LTFINTKDKIRKKGGLMENILIEYPKCSTCQKAKKWLKENNIKFAERHITEDTPNAQELEKWIQVSQKDIKKFFNTSGLKYKELKLKEKLTELSNQEKLQLLSSDGMLIKRPLLITKNTVLVGFKENEWKKEFNKDWNLIKE